MSTTAHLEVFQSEFHMLQFFGKYLPLLDVNASGRLAPFLYAYGGDLVLARNLYEFLEQMESLTALDIDTRASVQKGKAFLVFFNSALKDPAKFKEASGIVLAKKENILPHKEEASPEEYTSLLQTTLVDTETEVKTGIEEKSEILEVTEKSDRTSEEKSEIIAQAEALRDDSKKAASKAALEAFGLTHGVSLSRAKTFDNMLEDLKLALL